MLLDFIIYCCVPMQPISWNELAALQSTHDRIRWHEDELRCARGLDMFWRAGEGKRRGSVGALVWLVQSQADCLVECSPSRLRRLVSFDSPPSVPEFHDKVCESVS